MILSILATSLTAFLRQASGKSKADFYCDDLILNDDRLAVKTYSGMPHDDLK